MKIRNFRKAIAKTLAGAGLLTPCVTQAADLNTNLVVNGNFENVDLAVTGSYNSPRILNWTGPNLFAYSHDGSSSNAGVVPDYADGADPPGAGHWYFTSNNTGGAAFTDVHDPDVFFQEVDVSTGATGSAIAAGTARYSLQGFFSSYLNDADFGNVRVDFRNAGSATIGTATINDIADAGPNNVWSLSSGSGPVPVGTASVRISLFGTPVNAGADGYIDNVDLRIIPEPSTIVLAGLGLAAAACVVGRRRRDES
jgi:PEP-CTERM motif-containing protein